MKDDDLPAEAYRLVAMRLRYVSQDEDDLKFARASIFGAICAHNLNIILAALDIAARRET